MQTPIPSGKIKHNLFLLWSMYCNSLKNMFIIFPWISTLSLPDHPFHHPPECRRNQGTQPLSRSHGLTTSCLLGLVPAESSGENIPEHAVWNSTRGLGANSLWPAPVPRVPESSISRRKKWWSTNHESLAALSANRSSPPVLYCADCGHRRMDGS